MHRAAAPGHLPRALHPFRDGQYRLLVGAMTLSLFGSGMWIVAVVWQVIELGGGPVDLSVVATGSAVGAVAAVLVGGVVADRVPGRQIMIAIEITKVVSIAAAAALALSGTVQIWHLAAVSFLLGVTEGFFYPAYSALLPAILPPDQLLAANGVEGMLRPIVLQAAGPAAASAAVAVASPGSAFALIAGAQLLGVLVLWRMKPTPERRRTPNPEAGTGAGAESRHPLWGILSEAKDGYLYMVKTPWLLGTLSYFSLLILVLMGPIEVLLPFAVRDQAGGGAGGYALVLASFGIGGAAGSLLVASRRLPRRYLTIMNLLWGLGCVPLAIIGLTTELWVMVLALFLTGFAFQAGGVIWGRLLQRRVPSELLGRVSSLDFFVSIALMPVSVALAGPVGETVGLAPAFLVAGLVPPVLAITAMLAFGMARDELVHPLDVVASADND
ncbi:MFS transporter [Cryobacterium sp. PH29-G1]|uniref:MFS transporter n=1 Tax=Cryobacterium sp. PH29-G1 TaxID=3046211 RepID=UPI0024B8F0C7|nr:MFS transporter [Cryobacterium sp. PH29-G1]MDJ0347863.1 MFS transporter [Cryobacterium sp. PH29-G1]